MYQEERILQIQQLLAQKGRLTKKEIMEQFSISSDTARRDILEVLKTKKALRTHGGIMLAEDSGYVFDFWERTHMFKPEKEKMAAQVIEQIPENGFCFLDVSTTLLLAAQELKKPCTIFTHSLDNAFALAQVPQVNVHVFGGELDARNRFFFSAAALAEIEKIKFDCCFIGAASLEAEGIFFKEELNAVLKQKVVQQSRQVTLVAENQKFFKQAHFKGADYQAIDRLITDQAPTNEQKNYFAAQTEIIY